MMERGYGKNKIQEADEADVLHPAVLPTGVPRHGLHGTRMLTLSKVREPVGSIALYGLPENAFQAGVFDAFLIR